MSAHLLADPDSVDTPVWALPHARLVARAFAVVEPGRLYRSGQIHRWWIRGTLGRLGIRRVVNLTSEGFGDPDKDAEREACARLGIDRRSFHLLGDGTGDPELYRQALSVVRQSVARREPVLVHCAAGACRTGALVAWYRMLVQGWPRERAFAELLRHGVRPKARARLLEYVTEHTPTVALGNAELPRSPASRPDETPAPRLAWLEAPAGS